MKFLVSQLAYFLSEGEVRRNVRALVQYLIFLAAVIALYTVLFHVIMVRVEGQDHSWLTGLYWVLVVMSTLGLGDITFQTDIGRLFSLIVLLSGILLLLVLLPFVFIRFFYAPWLEARIRMRAPREVPANMTGHVLICAWDSIAPGLVERLKVHQIPYVVLEPDAAKAGAMHDDGIQVVAGDIESVAAYRSVHVERARLVFANAEDTTNTNIVLTVREIAPQVPIASLVMSLDSIDVLELSGANHVLPLSQRLGEQLANRVNAGHARCHVVGRYLDLLVAEFPVHNTPLRGRTLRETRLREYTQTSIVGVWERGRLVPAYADLRLSEYSVPVVLGTTRQIAKLDELLVIYDANESPVVVLGGGKVGRAAARSLKRQGIPVHLVEKNRDLRDRIGDAADQLFIGDAADRDVLARAGLDHAPSVLLTTHDDATNIYLAVYCRRLKPDVRLVSRITHEKNMEAVLRAGADFVLSYASLGVDSLMSILLGSDLVVLGEGINLFHMKVPDPFVGRTLAESGIGARTGLNVIGIQRDGHVDTAVGADQRLAAGNQLVMLGSREQRAALVEMIAGATR
jgi:Trk K+ transport system NAD-binding subunit